MPGLPDPQQLVLVVFLITATSANPLPALVVVPCATCAGGLFPSSTGAYSTCTYCNLHCVGGGDGIYVLVLGACGDAGCMQMWWPGNFNKYLRTQCFLNTLPI